MKRAASLAAVLFLLAGLAFAGEVSLKNTSKNQAAAMGKVKLDTDRNGNTTMHVEVQHLAQPSSVAPEKNSYVVWIQAKDQPPQNAGELRVNKDSLEGDLTTATPYKHFDVFITAEESPRAQSPSGDEVLRATVDR